MSESLQERQNNELEVLKAIFGASELQDLRGPNVHQPLELILSLTPQQGNSGPANVHTSVDLHITCGEHYPNEAPVISFAKTKGLSTQAVSHLADELQALAEQKVGEVMIYDLAHHVQKFLLPFNSEPRFQSFYDEMKNRQAQQETMKKRLIEEQLAKERQEVQEQYQRKQQGLRDEQRWRRDHHSPSHGDDTMASTIWQKKEQGPPSPSNPRNHRRTQSFSGHRDRSHCDHPGLKLIVFGNRQVRRGQCIGHSPRGSVVFVVQDVETGEALAVSQWLIKCAMPKRKNSGLKAETNPELAALMKQIAALDQEVLLLQRLHHSSLVRYLGFTTEFLKDHLAIYLLQDLVFGVSLSMFLEERLALGLELLRHVARGVLEPLAFLHNNNVIHRDLRHTCVFLQQTGNVMLSGYCLDNRLNELLQGQGHTETRGEAPALPLAFGRGGKKCDVHRVGSLLLSLVQGEPVTATIVPVIPPGLPPELKDFLDKCLDRDEHSRFSAQQLLAHPFLQPVGDRQSPQRPLTIETNRDRRESIESLNDGAGDSQLLLPSSVRGGPSRVQAEFEVLQWLGKGAFGDVLKVKNKLDDRVYALKRIKLNPRNKALNRKIMREVKLLSRLNHEHVVRYFFSWIENATQIPGDETPSTCVSASSATTAAASFTPRSFQAGRPADDGDNDSSSDDEEPWLFQRTESSDGIVFQRGDDEEEGSTTSTEEQQAPTSVGTADTAPLEPRELQFMYIQMEFCEKANLRNVIDSGTLHCDEARTWRLFREIVEGLAHIHQQGMIHRDLKPLNVFLDLHDHVKIGDFGLATFGALHQATPVDGGKDEMNILSAEAPCSSQDLGDGNLTGQVGTALYTAPELSSSSGGKAVFYNQKVDIYSLGIMFFEMCHAPLGTTMERVKVLAALRSPQIVLPDDFSERDHKQQVTIIKWLLAHDPAARPSAREILRAECLPGMQLEETRQQDIIRQALARPDSKAYQHLIQACLDQTVSAANDLTYFLGGRSTIQTSRLFSAARDAVERVFERHGAVRLSTPLLMPRSLISTIIGGSGNSAVSLMTHSGAVVMLPHDLRVPLARHVPGTLTTPLKRFSVERVYRERKAFNLHPKELYECAFDIISPLPASASPVAGSVLAEAEVLAVAWEVLCEVAGGPPSQGCELCLNHTSVLRAILLHCGLDEERYTEVFSILSEARDRALTRAQVQTRLLSLCLPRHMLDSLSVMLIDAPLAQCNSLKSIARGRGSAATLAKEGLKHLETIVSLVEAMGLKCPVTISPGMVLDPARYSGLLCQLVIHGAKKQNQGSRESRNVIAMGGTYTQLLEHYRTVLDHADGGGPGGVGGSLASSVSACGISLSLERLVMVLQGHPAAADVAICAMGPLALHKRAPSIARELWAAGIRAYLVDTIQRVETAQALCEEMTVPNLILLRDAEPNEIVLRSRDKDKFQDKGSKSLAELVEILSRKSTDTSSSAPEPPIVNPAPTSNVPPTSAHSGNPSINFHFVTSEKLAYNIRRRHESQITGQLASVWRQFSSRGCLEVVALSLEGNVVRSLATTLELSAGEEAFFTSVVAAIDKHVRHKKYLSEICDKLHELKFEKSLSALIMLYSLPDSVARTLF